MGKVFVHFLFTRTPVYCGTRGEFIPNCSVSFRSIEGGVSMATYPRWHSQAEGEDNRSMDRTPMMPLQLAQYLIITYSFAKVCGRPTDLFYKNYYRYFIQQEAVTFIVFFNRFCLPVKYLHFPFPFPCWQSTQILLFNFMTIDTQVCNCCSH